MEFGSKDTDSGKHTYQHLGVGACTPKCLSIEGSIDRHFKEVSSLCIFL